MTISCLLGRHWPLAALSEWQDGPQHSACVDCGRPMAKTAATDWRALPAPRARARRVTQTA